MSHVTQMRFVELVSDINGSLVRSAKVLEIGSYDVNGSVRDLFSASQSYVGVDLIEGPGVDIVSYGHELDMPAGSFDIAISCECFEHDVHWAQTFTNMAHLTRGGGLVAFTCASRARPEHGTRRTTPGYSPGTQDQGSDYYRNLTQSDVEAAVDISALFDSWMFAYQPDRFDLYFAGVRKGQRPVDAPESRLPGGSELARVREVVGLPTRAKGVMLRALRATSSEQSYQERLLRMRRARSDLSRMVSRPTAGRS